MRSTHKRITKLEHESLPKAIGVIREGSKTVQVGKDQMTPEEFESRYPAGVILKVCRVDKMPDAMELG